MMENTARSWVKCSKDDLYWLFNVVYHPYPNEKWHFLKKNIFGSQLKKKNYIFSSSFILSSNKNTFKSIDIKINFQISKNKTCYKF